jgi:D-alanyl-D-alanine dipeptidase
VTALKNRKLLRTLMEQNGFKVFDTEWWHFYITDGHYEVLDLSFKQLAKIAKSKDQH